VQFLTDILAPFRVGIQPLRIRIRSQPKNGIVRGPSTPVVSVDSRDSLDFEELPAEEILTAQRHDEAIDR
jgi:hypothetical protein